jgi:hypothetical protein
MSIAFRFPKWVMIIGMGHNAGYTDVPEASFMRNMPDGFMTAMLIAGFEWPEC